MLISVNIGEVLKVDKMEIKRENNNMFVVIPANPIH